MTSPPPPRWPDEAPTAFQLLLAEVRAIPMPQTTREQFERLFRSMQGERFFAAKRDLVGVEKAEFALALLLSRTPIPEIRCRLMARFGIGRRSAYRVIERALVRRHLNESQRAMVAAKPSHVTAHSAHTMAQASPP